MAENKVLFKKGNYASYQGIGVKDENTLYFCEDVGRLFQGSHEYTRPVLKGEVPPSAAAPSGSLYIDTVKFDLYHYDSSWSKIGSLVSSISTTGEGNVVTALSFENGVLTVSKTITAATSEELGALEGKVDAHTSNQSNPHKVTAAQINAYTKEETDAAIDEKVTEAGAHTHENKEVLDGITSAKVTSWDTAKTQSDANKSEIESLKTSKADKSALDALGGRVTTAEGEIDALQSQIEGLTGAMHFIGETTTELTDGSTTNPVRVGEEDVTAKSGDVVIYGNKEFVFNGTAWKLFGDTADFLLKSVAESTYLKKTDAESTYASKTQVAQDIQTAKTEAISEAGTAADQKISALNLGTMSTKNADDYSTTTQVTQMIEDSSLVWGSF